MLIDNNTLKNVQKDGSTVWGKSAHTTSLLKENEAIYLFDGVQSTLSFVEKHLPTARRSKSSEHYESLWNQFETYQDAVDTFKHRPGSLVKYTPAELDITDYIEKGLDLEYDLTGDFIDIGRVVEGIPETFGSLHNGNPRNRRVRIVNTISNSCDLSERDINHKSERIIRLTEALEMNHTPVEFLIVDSTGCVHSEIVVKRFNEPLVIEDVAVVTNVDFFRRLCFRMSEYSDTWSGGYGSSLKYENSDNLKTLRSALNDEITIFMHTNMYTQSIDKVFDDLEKLLSEELSQQIPQICLFSISNSGINKISF